jgi:hypothetical protein
MEKRYSNGLLITGEVYRHRKLTNAYRILQPMKSGYLKTIKMLQAKKGDDRE